MSRVDKTIKRSAAKLASVSRSAFVYISFCAKSKSTYSMIQSTHIPLGSTRRVFIDSSTSSTLNLHASDNRMTTWNNLTRNEVKRKWFIWCFYISTFCLLIHKELFYDAIIHGTSMLCWLAGRDKVKRRPCAYEAGKVRKKKKKKSEIATHRYILIHNDWKPGPIQKCMFEPSPTHWLRNELFQLTRRCALLLGTRRR